MQPLVPPRSPESRQSALVRLSGEPSWDLLVVGGGITGAAVARDAALRGLSVALLEQHDLAYGTSSRSSRLLHGGLRYLAGFELSLVREGLVERQRLLEAAPGLARSVEFLYPVYRGDPDPFWQVRLGTWVYHRLAGRRRLGRRRRLLPAEVGAVEPELERHELVGAVTYRDGAAHDARLTLAVALSAARAGALVITRVAVTSLVRDSRDRVIGVEVEDGIPSLDAEVTRASRGIPRPGSTFPVRARIVALCTGPWQELHADIPPIIRTARGTHISVPHARLPVQHSVALRSPRDGRLTFTLPQGGYTVLGTTDDHDPAAPAEVRSLPTDVDYLLESARAAFPDRPLGRDDVCGVWSGQRPLIADPDARDPDALSRRHQVVKGAPGLWILAGGKLTTHRRMAEDLLTTATRAELDGAAGPCRTADLPLLDGDLVAGRRRMLELGVPSSDVATLEALYGARLERLAGRIADTVPVPSTSISLRVLAAQAALAAEEEWTLGLDDFLLRRLHPGALDLHRCLALAPRAAALLAAHLGWSSAERETQIEAFRIGVEAELGAAGLASTRPGAGDRGPGAGEGRRWPLT